MKRLAFFFLPFLLLITMACSISVNLPDVQTGDTQTFEINEAAPAQGQDPSELKIAMGAGKLKLNSGAKGLVEGTVIYNLPTWEPKITRSGSKVRIEQEAQSITTGSIKNEWDLKLGSMPLNLDISAGAYDGEMDLSGLALNNLTIADGASKSQVFFKTPNPQTGQKFTYTTGASSVEINGLGNANFNEMRFEGGAGNYVLDFSGKLRQDSRLLIKSGVSNIKIVLPKGMRTKVTISGGFSNVDLEGTWTREGKIYSTTGDGPGLEITIDMGMGNLNLISR